MPKEDVDSKRLRISVAPPPDSSIQQVDDVYIVISQAYCPAGHNLIDTGNDTFQGYPGIKVILDSEDRQAELLLSPYQGDSSKKGHTDWPAGTRFTIRCPICSEPLKKMATCNCPEKGDLVKVYLSPSLSDSHVLGLCNIWGCQRSRTIDNWQIISEYLEGQIED